MYFKIKKINYITNNKTLCFNNNQILMKIFQRKYYRIKRF